MEYEVYPTLLHMTSSGNQTPDFLILSPTSYPLGDVFPSVSICLESLAQWTGGQEVLVYYGTHTSCV